MVHTDDKTRLDDRQHKNDEAQQLLEERAQLLDTIRKMINDEMDRRTVGAESTDKHSKPPLHPKPRRRTFLQWLRSLL